jgi:hypothetical protein
VLTSVLLIVVYPFRPFFSAQTVMTWLKSWNIDNGLARSLSHAYSVHVEEPNKNPFAGDLPADVTNLDYTRGLSLGFCEPRLSLPLGRWHGHNISLRETRDNCASAAFNTSSSMKPS